MMMFAVVAISSLIVALFTLEYRWRPAALGAAFFLRIAIPSYIGDVGVPGLLPSLHVSTTLILSCGVVWTMASRKLPYGTTETAAPIPILWHVALGAVALGSIVSSESLNAMGSAAGLVLNQMVAPYLFCMLVYATSRQSATFVRNAGRLFAIVCVFESMIAIMVYVQILPQPFISVNRVVGEWVDAGRHPATLDHAITLGLLLVAGMLMTVYFRSRLTAISALIIMMVGIYLTQSRIALAGAIAAIAYLFFAGSKSFGERMIMLFAVGAGFVILSTSELSEGVLSRIQDDAGSTSARMRALQLFADNWTDFVVSGVGIERNKLYFNVNGLVSSGESAAICYAVGIGIPLTLLYFFLIVWIIGHCVRHTGYLSPPSASAIIVLVSIQFYSSIATESAAGLILWSTIGVALAATRPPSRITTHDTGPRPPSISANNRSRSTSNSRGTDNNRHSNLSRLA
ncbi:O-antigen ligase family protein [Mycolicibacterium iranicum]|uniref:O-antigen ligase-related domain-containing protein n=1 Tax=Mycolicibacterium iranicum TaxID=912594 RepID=A0ABT4HFM3_MYCIR|nr:O-antigen ligase family protein [Mycolicibacterium iranicum]MCZ0728995.1 hypothetical protein [Mycolicibacterium iranicum]